MFEEVNSLQAAVQAVWVPELVINVNKVKYKLNAAVGQKPTWVTRKNSRMTSSRQRLWG